jgi:hypothetical protein
MARDEFDCAIAKGDTLRPLGLEEIDSLRMPGEILDGHACSSQDQ